MNVGKSSFLNLVLGQDFAITSSVPGTTTDVVEKKMELLPIGPVVFLDTAGVDDISELSEKRINKTLKSFDRADVFVLILEPNVWTEYEDKIINWAISRKTPVIGVINKSDISKPNIEYLNKFNSKIDNFFECDSLNYKKRDFYVNEFKRCLIDVCPDDFLKPPTLLGDLIQKNKTAVFIVPIDIEAPKGRLILPQMQAIRDVLDNDGSVTVVKETNYKDTLNNFKIKPDIVVCDSQVVDKMIADTQENIKCTTFSILFSRNKGDLLEMIKGAEAIDDLQQGDKILVAEACSHHAMEDDIGRVKMPKWLKEYLGFEIKIDVFAGRDFPDNLKEYKLVVLCGSCMLTRRETLHRIQIAKENNIPLTNYGLCISFLKGVLKRVIEPFSM
jgi:[FeFe] hydrogenase H-cluster maturation GTPase HydF